MKHKITTKLMLGTAMCGALALNACSGRQGAGNDAAGGNGSTAVAANNADMAAADDRVRLLIGRYSAPGENALEAYSFDPETASAQFLYEIPVENASFLDISDSGVIYAVSESGDKASQITALRLDPDGRQAHVLNRRPVGSADPCYVKVSPDGRFVVTANYTGGTVAVFPVNADGSLGERRQLLSFDFGGKGAVPDRQDAPHPHCISFTRDGRWMLVDDLGNDVIHRYAVVQGADSLVASRPDAAFALEPGSGPRHITFNAKGDMAYLINELSDRVTVLKYDGSTLTPVQYIDADNAGAGGAADIHLSADGRHLYASLRLRHDGIARFDVDPETGRLTYRGHTPTAGHPRNFTLTPDGRYMFVACRDGNKVEIYKIDEHTGSLIDKHRSINLEKPVYVNFYPTPVR